MTTAGRDAPDPTRRTSPPASPASSPAPRAPGEKETHREPAAPSPLGRFRRVRLRGGESDGSAWAGDIDIGHRVACARRWSRGSVYLVTAETTRSPRGYLENVAVVPDPF